MAADSNMVLAALGTVTASGTTSALDLKTGTPRRGLKARITYSAGTANAAGTVAYEVQDSADGTTFARLASNASDATFALGLSGATVAGQVHIPFETSKRYIRVVETFSGGTAPSLVRQMDVVLGRPG